VDQRGGEAVKCLIACIVVVEVLASCRGTPTEASNGMAAQLKLSKTLP
jgi:hypothetical protein